MKIRIKGDTIRFRLGPVDVREWLTRGRLVSVTRFGPTDRDVLGFELLLGGDMPTIASVDRGVVVSWPAATVRSWADGDQVGIDFGAVTIEKDFRCLDRDTDEDAYPNPKAC